MANPNRPSKNAENAETQHETPQSLNQKYIKNAMSQLNRLDSTLGETSNDNRTAKLLIEELNGDLEKISKDLNEGKTEKLRESASILDRKLIEIIKAVNPILIEKRKTPIEVPRSTLLAKAGRLAEELSDKKEEPKPVTQELSETKERELEALTQENETPAISAADVILGEQEPGALPQRPEREESYAETGTEIPTVTEGDKTQEIAIEEETPPAEEEAPEEETIEQAPKKLKTRGKISGFAEKKGEEKLPPRNVEKGDSDANNWEMAMELGKTATGSEAYKQSDVERGEKPEIDIKALATEADKNQKLLKTLSKLEDESLKEQANSFTKMAENMDELFDKIKKGQSGPNELGEFLKELQNFYKEVTESKYIVEKLQDAGIELSAFQGEKLKFKDDSTTKEFKVFTGEALTIIYSTDPAEIRRALASAGRRSKSGDEYAQAARDIISSEDKESSSSTVA